MKHLPPSRSAGMAIALSCLFAIATLLVSAWPTQAQSAASAPVKPILVAPGGLVTLAGHVPIQVLEGTATRVSHYNPQQKLRLVLGIQPPHLAEEEQFLQELQTKGSPNFHQFLTPEQWNARFAPSAEDEQKVVDWAESQGFTVTHRFNHRLLVDVEAPAGVIENALGVTIDRYQVPSEPDLKFSIDHDPVIPASLSGIVHNIEGLNSIQHDHGSRPDSAEGHPADYAEGPPVARGGEGRADADPAVIRAAETEAGKRPPPSNFGPPIDNNELTPAGVYSSQVYNYDGLDNLGHCCNPHNDSGGSPNVSSIAIAAFGNYNGSDIAGFHTAFPYLAENYSTWLIDGNIDCSSDPTDCPSGETTQDLEWTIATANSFGSSNDTSHIWVYIGANYNNGTFTDLYGYMLSDNDARVFTTSWSCTENYQCSTGTMDDRHNIFNNMVGEGWTLIAASGDRGSSDDCYLPKGSSTYNTAHEAVAYPGSDYLVLAAGGTQLQVYNDGSWDYEHAWQGGTYFGACGQNNGGSGGGISSYYAKQAWQSFLGGSKRQSPDISLNALGVGQSLYFNGKLQGSANGTSVVAPELAGFFAQENSYLNYIGHICGTGGTSSCTPVGDPMSFFYAPAQYGAGYVSHYPFYDMTGNYCNNNDVTASQGLGYYCTKTGWDNVTGWGSANMLQLAWAINWYLIPATGSGPTVTFSGPATGRWYNSDQQISWTIKDPEPSGSTASSGVAGFTQGWDSLPSDSFSKPHGGTGDTYWSGPEYPNYTDGCMTLVGNPTCPGGVSQGCHTAHVRGWNNQGWTTGDQTYGSICYDITPPTISVSNIPSNANTNWVNQSVQVTLTPTDPGSGNGTGSGIKKTYYAINSYCSSGSLGSCSVYNGPITISEQLANYIYYFTEDNAGNFSNESFEYVYIDTTPPVTTVGLSGTVYSGSTYDTAVNVSFNWSDNLSQVHYTYYELDGGPAITYDGIFTVSTLGSHTVKYWSVDYAGNIETAHVASFSIVSPTTAAVVATPSPSFVGQSVKITGTVKATVSGTPTGSVIFYNGATNLGAGTLTNGVASITTTALPAGALTLQISYAGAGNYLATNSPPFDQTVDAPAALTAPVASQLTGRSATFTWSAVSGVEAYEIWIGSTGAGSWNLYASGPISGTSATPNNLPTNGEKLYVRLFTELDGAWESIDYTFNAAALGVLTTPSPTSTLAGPDVTFSWSAGSGSPNYQLWIGSTGAGSNNVYWSGTITGTSATAPNLPCLGKILNVRLYTELNGTWVYADYTYTEATQAALTAPSPGSTLTGADVTFTWSAGIEATDYKLWLGATGVGSDGLYAGAATTTTSVTLTNMPTTGGTIYARLFTNFKGTVVYTDYTFKAASSGAAAAAETAQK